MIQPMHASPSRKWTMMETMGAVSPRAQVLSILSKHSWYLTEMIRPAQTARSERTREALVQAAMVRFLAQGVEDTSAEQIAADAGVSLRTFYRHFGSKHDLLFADYTGLNWFRAALDARPADEPVIDSVQAAIFAFPYDVEAVAKIGAMRGGELDQDRI